MYSYFQAVEKQKISSSYFYAELILKKFLTKFSNRAVNIPYKDINVLQHTEKLIEENKILEEKLRRTLHELTTQNGSLDMKTKQKTPTTQDKLKLEKEIQILINEKETLVEILTYIKMHRITRIENIFLKTRIIQDEDNRRLWQNKFLNSEMSLNDRCKLLKDLIINITDIKTLQKVFYNIFLENNNQKKRELAQAFRKNEKAFQQELLYRNDSIKLICLLNQYKLIDTQNILISNPKLNEKQSILSLVYNDVWKYSQSFWSLYDNLNIPQEIRDVDDEILLEKLDIYDIVDLVNSKKFKMTSQKQEVLLRHIRKYLIMEGSKYPLVQLSESLKYKVNTGYIKEMDNELERKTINKRRELIERLISILKFASEQSTSVQVSEVLTRVRAKKDEN